MPLTVALEDGGHAEALGGSIGWWFKIAAAALGGSGAATAEEHATMASASASLKPRASYHDIGVSIGKDGKRGCVQCEGMCVDSDGKR